MDDRVAVLLAKQDITEVIFRYARALDRMDRELAETVWHSDGTCDYGFFQGTGKEFLEWLWPNHWAVLGHQHQLSNVMIEVDGDRAGSETYLVATLWANTAQPGMAPLFTQMTSRGRYIDSWSCRDGVWAIDHRRFAADLIVTSGLPGTPAQEPGKFRGTRDRNDISYEVLDRP